MRKRFLCLFMALSCVLGVLSACGRTDADISSDAVDEPVDEVADTSVDEIEELAILDISEFLNSDGFVSAEKAYATNRGSWHDMLGEPAVSEVTYDGTYVAECYLYVSEDESWGQFLEFDYQADAVGPADEPDAGGQAVPDDGTDVPSFTVGADSSLTALPQLIRYVVFTDESGGGDGSGGGSDTIAVLDDEHIMSGSMLMLNRQLFLKDVDMLVGRIGEPDNSELGPWGYASWDMDPVRFIVYLDSDMNILYGHRVPLWDESDESASDEADSGGGTGDGSVSDDGR